MIESIGVGIMVMLMTTSWAASRIADELKLIRLEQRRQFDLERQYPRAQ